MSLFSIHVKILNGLKPEVSGRLLFTERFRKVRLGGEWKELIFSTGNVFKIKGTYLLHQFQAFNGHAFSLSQNWWVL